MVTQFNKILRKPIDIERNGFPGPSFELHFGHVLAMEILVLAHDVAVPGMELMDDAIPVHLVKSTHPYLLTQIRKVLSKDTQVDFFMRQRSDVVAAARKRVYPTHNNAHDRHIPFLLMAKLDGLFQLIRECPSIP